MNVWQRFKTWLHQKTAPTALTGAQWTGTSFQDAFKRFRNPTANELMAELKNTAWTCASLNSSVCATYTPALYVITEHHQPRPKCATKALHPSKEAKLRANPQLRARLKMAEKIEEVTDHPLIDLLASPNPHHSAFDLWELTTLYQEVHGSAYWFLDMDALFGVPQAIWLLPAQNVTAKRKPDSNNIVDYFCYRTGSKEQLFPPEQIVHFRYPDPREPYLSGVSPLKACFEQVSITSDYTAMKQAKFHNSAIPDAIVTPEEVVGEEERDRLEAQWNQRFRKAGNGRVVVAESNMKVQTLSYSLGDLAALAEMGKTKEDIANAFHVPISFFTTNTNLANIQASNMQHMQQAIAPRLTRRDERLNAQLVPLFDPTGRLFLSSEDPVPVDADANLAQQTFYLQYGIISINEHRSGMGLPPVPWGHVPWLPTHMAPSDVPRTMAGTNPPDPSSDYGTARTGDDPLVSD